eukprot:364512-Chlamydomonas_euryale.AAC.4
MHRVQVRETFVQNWMHPFGWMDGWMAWPRRLLACFSLILSECFQAARATTHSMGQSRIAQNGACSVTAGASRTALGPQLL